MTEYKYAIEYNQTQMKDSRKIPFDVRIGPYQEGNRFIEGRKFTSSLEELKKNHKIKSIMLNGFSQLDLEEFCKYAPESLGYLDLSHCPDIRDFSPFEKLINIQYINIEWNRKATKLWNLSQNKQLTYLHMTDCNKVTDFSSLRDSNVVDLGLFGCNFLGSFTPKLVIDDMDNIFQIKTLKRLSLAIAKTYDIKKTLISLSKLNNLEMLRLQDDAFTFEQFAWLKSKLPNVVGLDGTKYFEFLINGEVTGFYSVIGKRKPRQIPKEKHARAEKYQKEFDTLVKQYIKRKTRPL